MRARSLLLLTLGALLAGPGCGDPAPPAPEGPAPVGIPATSRRALSASLDRALEARDLGEALRALDALQRDHEGRSESPRGEVRSRETTLGAVFDAAVAEARRAIEGPAPDRARAERALGVARDLGAGVRDPASQAALAAARRWVELTTLTDLKTRLAPHAGPRVLVVADDYDLAEAALSDALVRWTRLGGREDLRAAVLPMFRGFVRVGTRRTRAKDLGEERAALDARLVATGLVGEPEPSDAAAVALDLGLLGQDAAVLVADRTGRIVARLSGRNLDPSPLDAVVQKVLSR